MAKTGPWQPNQTPAIIGSGLARSELFPIGDGNMPGGHFPGFNFLRLESQDISSLLLCGTTNCVGET